MKKLLLVIALVASGLTLGVQSSAQASGNLATSSSNTVRIITAEDGTTYLSTEIDEATATASTRSARTTGNRINLLGPLGIEIPEGFARNLAQVINAVLSFVMVIAALLVLLYLIWGAFDWITSGGDKGKIEGARQKIVAAIIGLIIVASSYAILILAVRFLGFESLDDVFDSVRTLDSVPTATTSATIN